MKALDTNVLVRYLAQDDPVQSPIATKWIEALTQEEPGFITQVSIIELVWVLTGCYDLGRSKLTNVLQTLLRTKEFVVDHAEMVWKAVRIYETSKADFADCLIVEVAKHAKCDCTVSFDKAAVKTAGMILLS